MNEPIIIYPPTVDWDKIHQRPQQLLKALSRQGFLSIFCNTNFERKRHYGMEQIHDHLILANNMTLNQVVSWARTTHSDSKIIIIHSYPLQVKEVHDQRADLVIFDTLDEPENEFAHWLPDYRESVQRADMVIASAGSLQERAKQFRSDEVLLLPNACDFDHFFQASKPMERPADMPIGRPVIGFFGAIATWLDWTLIQETVMRFDYVNFVFIGPFYGFDEPPAKANNLFYLREKPYDVLPAYLSHFDACWVPFKINAMTKGVSPIKMWEYLASGKPVISTALPEAIKAQPYVHVIHDKENWLDTMKGIVLQHDVENIEFARHNSWDERAGRLAAGIRKKINVIPFEMEQKTILASTVLEKLKTKPAVESEESKLKEKFYAVFYKQSHIENGEFRDSYTAAMEDIERYERPFKYAKIEKVFTK